jgi:steroid 5-alpha reductase family enzyme
MRMRHFIDPAKGITALVILGMMAVYRQWGNTTAWVYLGLHGSYGFLWVMKSRYFPDSSWERPAGLAYGLAIWGGLALYLVAPWIITSQGVQAPPWLLGLAVAMFGFGVFFHFAGDMEKYTSLKLRPGQLVTDSLMSLSHNTNYFGELLIYTAFASLAMHWVPFVVLALFLAIIWIPNMVRKERRLSKKEGYAEYKRRSKIFFPFVF